MPRHRTASAPRHWVTAHRAQLRRCEQRLPSVCVAEAAWPARRKRYGPAGAPQEVAKDTAPQEAQHPCARASRIRLSAWGASCSSARPFEVHPSVRLFRCVWCSKGEALSNTRQETARVTKKHVGDRKKSKAAFFASGAVLLLLRAKARPPWSLSLRLHGLRALRPSACFGRAVALPYTCLALQQRSSSRVL